MQCFTLVLIKSFLIGTSFLSSFFLSKSSWIKMTCYQVLQKSFMTFFFPPPTPHPNDTNKCTLSLSHKIYTPFTSLGMYLVSTAKAGFAIGPIKYAESERPRDNGVCWKQATIMLSLYFCGKNVRHGTLCTHCTSHCLWTGLVQWQGNALARIKAR